MLTRGLLKLHGYQPARKCSALELRRSLHLRSDGLLMTSFARRRVPRRLSERPAKRGTHNSGDGLRLVLPDRPPLGVEIGESQVPTTAATDTCSGLDALLLQSLFVGASRRAALALAGRRGRCTNQGGWFQLTTRARAGASRCIDSVTARTGSPYVTDWWGQRATGVRGRSRARHISTPEAG